MARKKTLTGEAITGMLDKFGNAPSRTIALAAYKKYPDLFKSVEHARSVVRYYRGAMGKKAAKRLSSDKYLRAHEKPYNPLALPEADSNDYDTFILSEACKRILFLYDVHVPYHDIEALTIALQYGLDNKADTIFLGGDFMDFFGCSRYQKDYRKVNVAWEFETGREMLKRIRELFPEARIYYLMGNHEERWENYLQTKAPELLDMQEFRMDVILNFGELNIERIGEKRVAQRAGLSIIHGHEFGGGVYSPVNPARGLYTKAKASSICGHHHRSSEHSEKDIDGKVTTTWSVGTLGELNPAYMPLNKWNQGFAFGEFEGEDYKIDNLRIINGKLV
jgi:predicted phosphodiesterase